MPPKLSIIMPAVDVPHGSGKPHFAIDVAIKSCLDSTGEFELLIGADGQQPAIKALVDSFASEKIRYFEYPYTGNWGNPQRNRLIKEASGTHVTYLDHDDAMAKGGIELALENADLFPDRPIMYRMLTHHGHIRWPKMPGVSETCPVTWDMILPDDELGPNQEPHRITNFIDCTMGVFPIDGVTAQWAPEENYNADWIFFIKTLNWFKHRRKDMLFVPTVFKLMRPRVLEMIQNGIASMSPEDRADFEW